MSTFTSRREDDHTIVQQQDADANDDALTIREVEHSDSSHKSIDSISTITVSHHGLEFESILEQSWVYRRNERNDCDCSFVSSVQRSYAWSVFSGYSLADISILSVIAMPLTLRELANARYYQTQLQGDEVSDTTGHQSASEITDTNVESTSGSHSTEEIQISVSEEGQSLGLQTEGSISPLELLVDLAQNEAAEITADNDTTGNIDQESNSHTTENVSDSESDPPGMNSHIIM